MENIYWITITYSLPMTPSRSRVYVWRKLKEMGAKNLKQGVSMLPSTPENICSMQALSIKIRAMSGESSVAELRFLEPENNDIMIEAFRKQSEDELKQFYIDMAKLYEQIGSNKNEYIQKVRKKYEKICKRDYFQAEEDLLVEKESFFSKFIDGLDLEENLHLFWDDMKKSKDEMKQKIISQMKEMNHKK